MPVLLLFFCSGATALVYEVVWSKHLSLMFGSTVQAQTVVLAVFMGGLALGNRIFGKRADKAERPLEIYGYMEAAIGLYAFFFEWIFKAADAVFIGIGSHLLSHGALLLALKGTIAVALLLGPTVMMGGTLPLVAAWLQRGTSDASRRSARFYSINSLGAVFGSGMAGFYLVQNFGMQMTLQITAFVNVLIGVAAVAMARREGIVRETKKPETKATAGQGPMVDARTVRFATLIVALSGGVSMSLEVLASRSLTLIFGASLQAFAVVLMSFILGIGIGSSVIASPRFHWLKREAATVSFLLAAAGMIAAAAWMIADWVQFYLVAKTGLSRTTMGYVYHQLLITGISLVVLGLPAGMLGAVLPLWIRTLAGAQDSLATQIGRLLTWNTLGGVIGVMTTGFVLMPLAGLRGAFCTLAAVLCIAALLTAWSRQRKELTLLSAGALALVLVVAFTGGTTWRYILSSGVFRYHATEVDSTWVKKRLERAKIVFYEDAPDATVSIERVVSPEGSTNIALRINGKVDASSEGDLATQFLLGHLPMLARPDAKDVFVLGFGSGITSGAVLSHPVDQLTIAENCEPVLRAAKFFEPWNRNVQHNERTRVVNEDARTVLKLDPKKYDVIISEPSNPWMVGVGSVFSHEFYELAASRLKDGGIMTQWFHVYEMHDGIIELVLRTFMDVFPYVEIWDPGVGDIIMLGSKTPWSSTPEAFRKAYEREAVYADFKSIGLPKLEWLWARQLASQRTGFAIPDSDSIQSDAFPVLEYEAPRAFYLGNNSTMLNQFDERTWQHNLAPAGKRQLLAALDSKSLAEIFARFSTANGDLPKYIAWRKANPESKGTPDVTLGPSPVPFIFRPTNAEPVQITVAEDASSELRALLQAEVFLQSNPDQWQKAVDRFETILKALPKTPPTGKTKWTRSHFYAVAARAAMANGDLTRAKSIIESAGEIDQDAELRFLARVLLREATTKAGK